MKGFLSELGWPEPLVGDSGNGAHILYRIDLPNDTGSRELVKGCLETLSVLISNHTEGARFPCLVDTATFTQVGIWKFYEALSLDTRHSFDLILRFDLPYFSVG